MTDAPKRLPLVARSEQLSGAAPAKFERLVRRARAGYADHRGSVFVVLTLCRDALRTTLPPSVLASLEPTLEVGTRFGRGAANEKEVGAARSLLFSKRREIDEKLVRALERALPPAPGGSPLPGHARHVALRHASLAGYFSVAALCHALDGARAPELLLESLKDQVGARAYLRTGLGAAKSPEFLARAEEQARFERERESVLELPPHETLTLQIFHEYLGARYRAFAEEERARSDALLEWALGGSPLA